MFLIYCHRCIKCPFFSLECIDISCICVCCLLNNFFNKCLEYFILCYEVCLSINFYDCCNFITIFDSCCYKSFSGNSSPSMYSIPLPSRMR